MGNFCRNCGSVQAPGVKFCTECGAPIPQEEQPVTRSAPAAQQRAFCPRCGSEVQPGAAFCASCGGALGTNAQTYIGPQTDPYAGSPGGAAYPAASGNRTQQFVTQQQQVRAAQQQAQQAQPPKKKKKLIPIIAVLLVVALGVGGFFAYRHFSKNKVADAYSALCDMTSLGTQSYL